MKKIILLFILTCLFGPIELPAQKEPRKKKKATAEAPIKEEKKNIQTDWANFNKYAESNLKTLPPRADEHRVLFMGNSITEFWVNLSPEFFSKNPYIGRGISGQTTPQMLLRFRQDIVDLQPETVVINAGINDIAENTGPYNADLTLDNLQSMAEIAKANNIKVILAAVHPASEFPWRKEIKNVAEKIIDLNARIKAYASSNGFVYLDYHTAMKNAQNGMDPDLAADGVHPTLKGYKIMEGLAQKAILSAQLLPPATHILPSNQCYELRIYHCQKGKLNDLEKRFRNHTTKLFEKHGMTNMGYWTPLDNPDEKLYYVLSYPDRAAREASWAAFMADTVWQRVWKESEVNGKIISKIENIFLKTTDFSPNNLAFNPQSSIWELRIYHTTPNNLGNLLDRFRNFTVKRFEKYGMTNKIYWTATDAEQGADHLLYYFLTHPSEEAAKSAFDQFRKDPEWMSVRKASEEKGGGSLTNKIESIFMYPTDFSTIR